MTCHSGLFGGNFDLGKHTSHNCSQESTNFLGDTHDLLCLETANSPFLGLYYKEELKIESNPLFEHRMMKETLEQTEEEISTMKRYGFGSQLQVVRQRNLVDVYTNEPVWKKIYPQENGVPVINKSGKYWVKMYYMGKEVKV